MIHPKITVTLTLDDIKLYDRAREIGLPSIVVSMYGDRIKKLLAEERSTEQEPVAWLCTPNEDGLFGLPLSDYCCIDCFPVYRHPPQRTWVGLTDEEIKEFDTWHDNREEEVGWCNPSEIVAYIEAKLKEKNT